MIWPFKRREVVPFETLAAQQPPAPCGDQLTHWRWELFESMGCPKCAADMEHARKLAAEERLAGRIAELVTAKLKGDSQ